MEQEQKYEVSLNGRVFLRGKFAVVAFWIIIMHLPSGFFMWPQGAAGTEKDKWQHRARLFFLYLLVYLFCETFRIFS